MRVAAHRAVGLGLVVVVAFLGGCTSLSGVGGDTHYACPAPRGVQCGSVTANYLQSLQGDPGQPPTGRVDSDVKHDASAITTAAFSANATANSDAPLRSPPRILKLWVAPWEDRDGVLHDGAFVFVPIDHGHWLVDHVHPTARLLPRPIRPPRSDAAVAPAGTKDGAKDGDAP